MKKMVELERQEKRRRGEDGQRYKANREKIKKKKNGEMMNKEVWTHTFFIPQVSFCKYVLTEMLQEIVCQKKV